MGNKKKEKPLFRVRNLPRLEPATVIANETIAASIEQNSQTSFLRILPQEIRDKIWAYAIGSGGVIHVGGHHCRTCTRKGPLLRLSSRTCIAKGISVDHKECCKSMQTHHCSQDCTRGNIQSHRNWNGLSFLLTCRQFYVEATPVLYKKTVFSFSSLNTLGHFVLSRNHSQKLYIKKLLFDEMEPKIYTISEKLQSRIMALTAEHLTNLRILYINECASWRSDELVTRSWRSMGVHQFRVLGLDKVVIKFSPDTDTTKWIVYRPNPIHKQREPNDYAEFVEHWRQLLLDPNGAETERREREKKEAEEEEEKQRLKRGRKLEKEQNKLYLADKVSAKGVWSTRLRSGKQRGTHKQGQKRKREDDEDDDMEPKRLALNQRKRALVLD